MNQVADIPLWAAIGVSLLLLAGSALTLAGAVGLLRFRSFYERLHAPTLGTSYGMGLILCASMLFFTVVQTRVVVHEIVIGALIIITTPITLMLLGNAALNRGEEKQ